MIDRRNPNYATTPVTDGLSRFCYAPALDAAPWVTIVTPFFNTGLEFKETAISVLRQSLQQWEWLIVNDGSTSPQSLEMLKEYRQGDPRITVIDHAENRGLSAARNTGYAAANASLVLQLDSDDLLEPTAAEKWCWYLETHPTAAFVKGFSVGFGAQQYLWERGFEEGPKFLDHNLVDPTAMVRRVVHQAVGGYDINRRTGLEDWHFWLRCANAGYWGSTIHEFLNWYRRRDDHADRWPAWDNGERQRAVRSEFKHLFPGLSTRSFPLIPLDRRPENAILNEQWPFDNVLKKTKPRLLFIVPWLAIGGADRFNLDLIEQLTTNGWEVTVATTRSSDDEWFSEYLTRTSDVFAMHRFLPLADHPRFLHYLIRSRQVDAVMVSHSELGYRLLPYLRSHCPDVVFMDYLHVVEPVWNQGGYPRFAVEYQEQIDLSVTSSAQVRSWMIERGADPERVEVCYTAVDSERYKPDIDTRRQIRREFDVPDDAIVVLYAGRLCEQKHPEMLITSVLRFLDRVPNASVWLAGDGPDRNVIERAMEGASASSRITLMGAVSSDRVRQCMMGADILFLPSRYEGIALVLYEAMATALPIVASEVGGQRELVLEDCGILITPSDFETDVARYVDALVGLAGDADRRKHLGDRARQHVDEAFRLDAMGVRIAELLKEGQRLFDTAPRIRPSPGLALNTATSAIELARLWELSAHLWQERKGRNRNEWIYIFLNRWLSPVHDWGVARGWTWPLAVGRVIRKVLLGHY